LTKAQVLVKYYQGWLMHKRTHQILKNLGYSDELVEQLNKRARLSKKTLLFLRKLGLPPLAIKQIKFLENYQNKKLDTKTNKELIEGLIKKCRRSLDAFANKNVKSRIVFKEGNWTLFAEDYSKPVEKLMRICKPHFDEYSDSNLEVTFFFDGTPSWKVMTNKKSDLPGK
jgi:hypothetical protein